MKRLVSIAAAAFAAVGIDAAPAIAGLAGNSSFSRNIPVRIPTHAHIPQLDDGHGPATKVLPTTARSPHDESADVRDRSSREPEPGENQGGASGASKRGDERRGARSEPEAGNNSSGASSELEPGEDGAGAPRQPEPADDHRGHSGKPNDDRGGARSDG